MMEFPEQWRRYLLGDLANYVNGRAFKPTEWGSKGLPIIRIQNLTKPKAKCNHFEGEVAEKHKIDDGDLLISWSATLGSFIWNRGPAALNQHIFKVLPNSEIIEKEFLHFLVLYLLDHLVEHTHGSTMKHITKKKFEAIECGIPPLQEQRRIVARIQECLSRVEEMERLQAEVAEDEKIVFLRFLEEEYDRLCIENKTHPLSECAEISGGGTPNRKNEAFWGGEIPWVSPKDMKRWEIDGSQESITKDAVSGSSVKMINSDSVLFVVRGMILLHTIPVAISRVPLTINQDMKSLLPKGGYSAEFLAFMLKAASPKLLRKVNIAGHGTRRLKTEDWIDLPIPDVGDKQLEIVDRLERFRAASHELISAQSQLDTAALRNAILRQAFAGEL